MNSTQALTKEATMRPRSPVGATALLGGAGLCLLARAASRRSQRLELRGQVVVITGGSRGLGWLLAREFATAGCQVAICARDETELDRAGKSWSATARRSWPYPPTSPTAPRPRG